MMEGKIVCTNARLQMIMNFDKRRRPDARLSLLLALLITGAAAAQSPIPPPPDALPFIDCDRRIYAVDTVVCADDDLRTESERIDKLYRAALAADAPNRARLEDAQMDWAKARNRCVFRQDASACVRRLQARRVRQLTRAASG